MVSEIIYYYDPENPTHGLLGIQQGRFNTPITESEYKTLISNLPKPKPEPTAEDLRKFIAYCFSGVDEELFQIWLKVDTLKTKNTPKGMALLSYYTDFLAAANGMFETATPPQAGGWGLAMVRMAEAMAGTEYALTHTERVKINDTLEQFNLPRILSES